jgi:hypothetical protein
MHYFHEIDKEYSRIYGMTGQGPQGYAFCSISFPPPFLFLFVMSLSLSLSYPSITACLYSMTPHDTSLTIIPPSLNQPTNHQSTQYSHYLSPCRYNGAALVRGILGGLLFGTVRDLRSTSTSDGGGGGGMVRSCYNALFSGGDRDSDRGGKGEGGSSSSWRSPTLVIFSGSVASGADNDYYRERAPLLGAANDNGFPRYSSSGSGSIALQNHHQHSSPQQQQQQHTNRTSYGLHNINVAACSEADDGLLGSDDDEDDIDTESEDGDDDDDDDASANSLGSRVYTTLSSATRGEADVTFLVDSIARKGGKRTNPTSYSLKGVRKDVMLLCNVLFVTMFTSIFQGVFFVYAKSDKGHSNVEQYLYFTRLFCDLLGRPLAALPRPSFVRTESQLWKGTLLRLALMGLFFL